MFKFKYPNSIELIAALKQTKKDYHLTNEQIAKAIGVAKITVSNWFNNKIKNISMPNQEKIEDYIAKIWQPALICIWNENSIPKGQFLLVGSQYDPFYTWINNTPVTSKEIKWLENLEKQVKNDEAKIYIVKKYVDMDEVNTIGRDDVQLYNIGAITGQEVACHIFKSCGQIIEKKAIVYEPKT